MPPAHMWLNLAIFASLFLSSTFASNLPGEGKKVQAVRTNVPEESFQTEIVNRALSKLGYQIAPTQITDYADAYQSIARGELTFLTVGWFPLHSDMYDAAGGRKALYRRGHYIYGAMQGYMIDKAISEQYGITNLTQLSDPKLAQLFDWDGDKKADLVGCNSGWGCERVINLQLERYGLKDNVSHHQGDYGQMMSQTVARYNLGQPVLYYTWTPYWVSGLLLPGQDVVWLEVPFSALPGSRSKVDTTLPNGKNFGFQMNSMRIVANKAFVKNNPAAGKLFSLMRLDINDVSEQNLLMSRGENSDDDINRHVDNWIADNQQKFDRWIAAALKAK